MSVVREVLVGRSSIDFRPKWRVTLVISAVLVLGSVVLLLTRGLNLSIDFEGGGVWEVPVGPELTVADARDALPLGADARIQLIGGSDSGAVLRVQAGTEAVERSAEISAAMAEVADASSDDVSVSTIGPTWGERITRSAAQALAWFFVVVALYLAWRLEWRMAVGAVAAVVHDLVVTAGIYSLFGFEVSPATVIALLTILGYSLYDTVVVFDKVLENERGPLGQKLDDSDLVNQSMNQVLMRSINTTVTTVLPVVSMLVIGGLFLGGASLRDFALALFVGLILGTYSSIFLAAPILVWLRAMRPEARHSAKAEAARESRAGGAAEPAAKVAEGRDISLIAPGGGNPRPRKKGKRR